MTEDLRDAIEGLAEVFDRWDAAYLAGEKPTNAVTALSVAARLRALLAAHQPPACPNHRESQHRDNKPPWCDSCGWRHGDPPQRYGEGKPCSGRNANTCVAEGCYGEACIRKGESA